MRGNQMYMKMTFGAYPECAYPEWVLIQSGCLSRVGAYPEWVLIQSGCLTAIINGR